MTVLENLFDDIDLETETETAAESLEDAAHCDPDLVLSAESMDFFSL